MPGDCSADLIGTSGLHPRKRRLPAHILADSFRQEIVLDATQTPTEGDIAMSWTTQSSLAALIAIATIVTGCGKAPDPTPPANITMALALEVQTDQLVDRAEQAEKAGNQEDKAKVGENAAELAGKIVESGALPGNLGACQELAEKTRAKDVQALDKLARDCKAQSEQPPGPDRDEKEVHRDRKLASVALKLAALVALAYGNPELASILWSLSQEAGKGNGESPNGPPPWGVSSPEGELTTYEGPRPETPAENVRSGDLPSENSGQLITNIDWNGGKVTFRDATSGTHVAEFNTAAIADWADEAKRPVKARRVQIGGGQVVWFEYQSSNGQIYMVTLLTGKAEPINAR